VFATPRVGEGEAPSQWARAAASADTAVIYMGAGQAEEVAVALIEAGAARDTPVLVAENASLPQARRVSLTLEELPQIAWYGITGPTLIMVGHAFAATLAAAEEKAQRKYAES
jgi:uroporphyrin-III C-methyltransferase